MFFIGFDGDGFAAAVKVFDHPDFIHKFFDKEALGISTSTTIQLSSGEKLNLLLTLFGLIKTTIDIEKGAYEPPFFYHAYYVRGREFLTSRSQPISTPYQNLTTGDLYLTTLFLFLSRLKSNQRFSLLRARNIARVLQNLMTSRLAGCTNRTFSLEQVLFSRCAGAEPNNSSVFTLAALPFFVFLFLFFCFSVLLAMLFYPSVRTIRAGRSVFL